MKINIVNKVLMAAVLTSLTGCATFHHAHNIQKTVNLNIKNAKMPKARPIISNYNYPYLAGREVKVEKRLPSILSHDITVRSLIPISLNNIASAITNKSSIPVVFGDMHNGSGNGVSASSQNGALPSPPSALLSEIGGGNRDEMLVNYTGPLNKLLNTVSAHFGTWWKYKNGEIVLYKYETKTFLIPAFPAKENSSSSITASNGNSMSGGGGGMSGGSSGGSSGGAASGGTSGGSSGGSSGGGTVSVNNSTNVDVWKNLKKLAEVVSNGAKVYSDASLGSMTVTGTPPQVAAVASWINSLNEQLGKQVSLTVHVYEIQLNNNQGYGFNPAVALNNIGSKYGLSFNSAPSPQISTSTAPMSFGAQILNGVQEFGGSGAPLQPSTTSAFVSALSTLGNIVSSYSYPAVTLNGEPVAIQLAKNTGYLASTSTTLAANVGSQSSLTPGSVTSGFTALMTPRVINNDIYLNMDITISTLTTLQAFSSNGNTIYTPDTTSFAEPQSVKLKSGSTLVLTSYNQNTAETNRNGVGSPYFPLLGGGAAAKIKHAMIVITVTAREL